jgi:hypothetical protein
VSGDFCLALPGGMVAKDMINGAAAKCPTSKIFVGGYSQGAMVVRNGVAYADPSAKALVMVYILPSKLNRTMILTHCAGRGYFWRPISRRTNQGLQWTNRNVL